MITAALPQGSRPLHPGRPATDKEQTVYTTTYYPGTLNEDQAVPVELHPGDETRINFGVLTSRVFRVSGTLTGVPDTAVAQLMLESRGHGGSPPGGQELAKDGKFEFEDVPPGLYTPMLLLATFGGGQPVSMQMLNVASQSKSPTPTFRIYAFRSSLAARFAANSDSKPARKSTGPN